MNCAEASPFGLAEYLYALGFQREKVRNNDYRYMSPLREKMTPPFKVNDVLMNSTIMEKAKVVA